VGPEKLGGNQRWEGKAVGGGRCVLTKSKRKETRKKLNVTAEWVKRFWERRLEKNDEGGGTTKKLGVGPDKMGKKQRNEGRGGRPMGTNVSAIVHEWRGEKNF